MDDTEGRPPRRMTTLDRQEVRDLLNAERMWQAARILRGVMSADSHLAVSVLPHATRDGNDTDDLLGFVQRLERAATRLDPTKGDDRT